METTHKDLHNGLRDCPESFHMEANKYKVFVTKINKTRSLAIFGPQISFGAKVPQVFWRCFGVVSIYNLSVVPSLI